MVGLIKKQILKHLSKFAKNLSADKIHLSTLRGEGELSNLELDCVALQNVMNLPTWLQISHATCNKVHVKIPWTKLKTTPISIFLDAVEVDMTTCEKPRPPNGPSPIQASASSGDTSYGFTEKVLEGMTVVINSISINFTSAAFNAKFELSQLSLVSTNPKWEITDLKSSHIQDKTLGQVLTFKKLSLQTIRIVANAMTTPSGEKCSITPLRLITNQCEFQMTFRRKTSDCSVLASRLHIIFDDLLWVLTDSQVQSALLCVKSLRDTIERSSQQMRELGLTKSHDSHQPPAQKVAKDEKDSQASSELFRAYTVMETALHLDFEKVDLHICEQSSPLHEASTRAGVQGGAIQISLHSLKVDHYPYHKPASGHHHFRDYGETMVERDCWAQSMIDQFRNDFATLKRAAEAAGNPEITTSGEKPARLVENCLIVRLSDINVHQVTTSASKKPTGELVNSTRKELHLPEEMPLLYFIRSEYYYPDGRDFPAAHDNIFMQINAPQIHAHWDSLIWLNRLSTVTVQAVQKMLKDLGIVSDEDDLSPSVEKDEDHIDIRIQVLMPKVFVPGPASTHSKQPHGLEIQVSKAAVTNCRGGEGNLRTDLKKVVEKIESQHLARNTSDFPGENGVDLPHSQELFESHSKGDDDPLTVTLQSKKPALTRSALIASATKDVWSVDLDNIWIDFLLPSGKKRKQQIEEQPTGGFLGLSKGSDDPAKTGIRLPFVDSFPAQLWVGRSSVCGSSRMEIPDKGPSVADNAHERYSSPSLKLSSNKCRMQSEEVFVEKSDAISPDRISVASTSSARDSVLATYILVHTDKALRLQLDHHQYLFLLRLIDKIEEVEKQLENSAREALSSTSSSRSSTPSHSTASHGDISERLRQKKSRPMTTTSVRLAAPSADLFLILRPPPSSQRGPHENSFCGTVDCEEPVEVNSFAEKIGQKILPSEREQYENHSSGSVSNEATEINSIAENANQKNFQNVTESEPCENGSCGTTTEKTTRETSPDRCEEEYLKGRSFGSVVYKKTSEISSGIEEEIVVVSRNQMVDEGSKVKEDELSLKSGDPFQSTLPVSEHGSDTASFTCSDDLNMSVGSSSISGGVYPHDDRLPSDIQTSPSPNPTFPAVYPHDTSINEVAIGFPQGSQRFGSEEWEQQTEEITIKESLLSKQKSESLSGLPSAGRTSKTVDKLPLRNHSSGNLRTSLSKSDQMLRVTDITTSKSTSSGYETGSHESLPINVKNIERRTWSHSRMSGSDVSEKSVAALVEDGKGANEFGVTKNDATTTTASISSGLASETSSLSNQSLPPVNQVSSKPVEPVLTCRTLNTQISAKDSEAMSKPIVHTSDKESQTLTEEREKELPEMSSQALLHVTDGFELAIDSNDVGDSVVKIAASIANVLELEARKSGKNDVLFVDYSAKDCDSMAKKLCNMRSPKVTPEVCLRVDSGPIAGRFSPLAAKEGNIQLSATGIPFNIKSSTLANLGAFLEDETASKVVPMKIEATDVKVTINDDMPPAYEVTPQPDPITLHVHRATVIRSDDGAFNVTTSSGGKVFSSSHAVLSSQPSIENNADASCPGSLRQNDPTADRGVESCDVQKTVQAHDASAEDGNSVMQKAIGENLDNERRESSEKERETNLADGKKGELEKAREENLQLRNTVEELRKKLQDAEAERNCLTATLTMMQEDLISSERDRANLRARSSSQVG